jgi:hypothetical protein
MKVIVAAAALTFSFNRQQLAVDSKNLVAAIVSNKTGCTGQETTLEMTTHFTTRQQQEWMSFAYLEEHLLLHHNLSVRYQ